jgi:hypothetical protein
MKMDTVSVVPYGELPKREWQEAVMNEMSNDSYRGVSLDEDAYEPEHSEWEAIMAEVAEWLRGQGVRMEGKYPYCLIHISW